MDVTFPGLERKRRFLRKKEKKKKFLAISLKNVAHSKVDCVGKGFQEFSILCFSAANIKIIWHKGPGAGEWEWPE